MGVEPLETRRLLAATAIEDPAVDGWFSADQSGRFLPCDMDVAGDAATRQADGENLATLLLADSLLPEVLPPIESDGSEGGPGDGPLAAGLPLSSVPALSSLPGAFAKLYLNFVGDTTGSWGSYHPGTTPAYDIDGDATTFSSTELSNISEMWSRVAEKYSPFNIDVTTIDPGNINNLESMRVVIGGDGSWYGAAAGGIAYVGSFYNSHPVTGKNIVFVFSKQLGGGNPRFVAEAAAHEAGHSFGLEHQSVWNGNTKVNEYNTGDSLRAPVMGASYNSARGLWWLGRSALPGGPTQDDMVVVSGSSNNFGYRADDHGNSVGAATPLALSGATVYGSGIIGTTSDADYFSFTTTPGTVRFTVSPASFGAMLDATLELRDASGTLLVSANTASLGESVLTSLAAGSYRVVVKSHASYGDVGQYTLVGTLPDAYEDNDSRPAAADIGVGTGMQLNSVNIDQSGDDDWYRFTLLAPDTVDVTATFNHAAGNLDLELVDVTGAVLASGASLTDNELVQLGNLTAGVYYIRVYGVAGATNSYSLGVLPGSLPLDLVAPQVTAVTLVGGGSLQSTYPVPAGSGEQIRVIPVGLVNQVRVTFSEAVMIEAADLVVSGSHVPLYGIGGFSYDGPSRTASWLLAQPIDADVVALQLNADGASPIVDLVGNRLDGEWDNPTSLADPASGVFPSGNGIAGGNFYFLLTLLPGDANRDNTVDAGDYTSWADHYLQSGTWATGDFSDDGLVDAADYTIWADHFLNVAGAAASGSLPFAEGSTASTERIAPESAAAAAIAASPLTAVPNPGVVADDLFRIVPAAGEVSFDPHRLDSSRVLVDLAAYSHSLRTQTVAAGVAWVPLETTASISASRPCPAGFSSAGTWPLPEASIRLAARDRLFAAGGGQSADRASPHPFRAVADRGHGARGDCGVVRRLPQSEPFAESLPEESFASPWWDRWAELSAALLTGTRQS